MNSEELLEQIMQTHPIIDGEISTLFSSQVIAQTYNVPMEVANEVAMEYNAECILNHIKQTHPIMDGEATSFNPEVIAQTYNIPMGIATLVAEKYNNEIRSMSQRSR